VEAPVLTRGGLGIGALFAGIYASAKIVRSTEGSGRREFEERAEAKGTATLGCAVEVAISPKN
jgi:hypothetical protein